MSKTQAPSGLGAEYHPLQSPHLESPHPFLARARREEPVFFSPALGTWVVTRHADISAVVADTARFSSAESITVGAATTPPEVVSALMGGYPLVPSRVDNAPPAHAHFRSLVSKAFTGRRLADKEPFIRTLVDELKVRTDRSPVECGGLVKRGEERPREGDTRAARRAGAEAVPPLGAHAGPSGRARRQAAGAWVSRSLWVLGLNTTRSGVDPVPGPASQAARAMPGAPEWRAPTGGRQVCQHPPAASTPRAGEDIQRERPAQQSRPIQSRRALHRRLHRRSLGRALLLQPRLRPRLRELGFARTRELLAGVDLAVLVLPPGVTQAEAEAWTRDAGGTPVLVVDGKSDVAEASDAPGQRVSGDAAEADTAEASGSPRQRVSGLTGEGVDALRDVMLGRLWGGGTPSTVALVSERHADALRRASEALGRAESASRVSTLEVVSGEVGPALEALGEVFGTVVSEALLDAIFQRFCIGK